MDTSTIVAQNPQRVLIVMRPDRVLTADKSIDSNRLILQASRPPLVVK